MRINLGSTIIQRQGRIQYYPSGLPWTEGIGKDVQNRKYNGKEFIEIHGYNTF